MKPESADIIARAINNVPVEELEGMLLAAEILGAQQKTPEARANVVEASRLIEAKIEQRRLTNFG